MSGILSKNDLLNLAIIILYSYFLLNLISIPTILSYERAYSLNIDKKGLVEIVGISSIVGIVFISLMYIISRLVFKQSELAVLASSLLMVSSYAFINNFTNVPDWMLILFSQFNILNFGVEKFIQVLPLLPLSMLSLYVLYSNKKTKYLFVGIVAVIASFFLPILSLPFLFVLNADGFSRINRIRDRRILSVLTGGLLATVISLIILGTATTAIALSILIGLIIAVVMFAFENKHTLLYLLILTLVMVSIQYGIANILNAPRVDQETISLFNLISNLEGKIAFASVYGEDIYQISKIETGKEILTYDSFIFLFTNKTPNFDYLVLDTLVLDSPKEYANKVNLTTTFETFRFTGIQKQGETYYQIYLTYKNDNLIISTDANGNLLSNRVSINGIEESYFKLLQLDANDSRYVRYIHPKSDANKNVFKLIYPEQFGSIEGYRINEISRTNSSRFRLYQLVKE